MPIAATSCRSAFGLARQNQHEGMLPPSCWFGGPVWYQPLFGALVRCVAGRTTTFRPINSTSFSSVIARFA